MDKYELDNSLQEEIRARVFGDGFIKLVQSVRRGGKPFKISLSPVEIGGVKMFQAEMLDDGHVQVKNFETNDAAKGLEEIIAQKGARDLHLITAKGDVHIRVTRKGKVSVSRSQEMNRVAVVRPHDRVKNVPLTQFDSTVLLKALSLADGEGNIRASMRGKYNQVNEFLKVVKETVDIEPDDTFTVVDCGCGKAYLTIALYFYLTRALGFKKVRVVGVDRRKDVIDSAIKIVRSLGVESEVEFVQSDLREYDIDKVDLVISLHACDTATNEALAKAVEWKSRYVLSAPCCQHELHKTLSNQGVFSGLLRQSILRERLCDILTDSFRAMIMRILGFKTQVIEFVSSESTARNIMIKCEYCVKPGQSGPVGEYLDLRDYWKVTPFLEGRLSRYLSKYLERYS